METLENLLKKFLLNKQSNPDQYTKVQSWGSIWWQNPNLVKGNKKYHTENNKKPFYIIGINWNPLSSILSNRLEIQVIFEKRKFQKGLKNGTRPKIGGKSSFISTSDNQYWFDELILKDAVYLVQKIKQYE